MMGPQYVELERDLTLLLWLGISMNDNLSQKQGVHWRLSYLSISSERTVWFLTVTKALIGDQHKYSLSAGLWVVKFHVLDCCIMWIRLRSLAVPWNITLVAFWNHSWRTSSRNQARESMVTCTECSMTFWFAHKSPGSLVLLDRYCFLWSMPYCVFCETNLLFLDELQVNGEGDGNTEMSCWTLCRCPLIPLLGFLSLSFKNDSKKPPK